MRNPIRLLVLVVVMVGSLLPATAAMAQGATIKDEAAVLSAGDQNAIRDAANNARFAVVVWTVNGGFAGNRQGFIRSADGLISGSSVIVAVDTQERFSHVAARSSTGLRSADTAEAQRQANKEFGAQHWGPGVVAAINVLANAAPAGSSSGGATQQRQGSPLLGIVIFALLIGGGIYLLTRLMRNRASAGGGRFTGGGPVPGQPGYGQPGYGQPGYGGGGINPLMAGGIGAVGGGLLGYELGRESAERHGDSGNYGNDAGNYGGNGDGGGGGIVESDQGWGNGGDFGGGGGGDFGGGGDSGGGGGDF